MNIKSLLLGSAAALAAVSGAQAADAIVAAEPEPMEYVRVCDAFGTGYFYIPGTETCLKIGGFIRFQTSFGENEVNGRQGWGPAGTSDWDAFSRAYISFDAKSDTEYGTLTGFFAAEFNADNDTDAGDSRIDVDEAYIQLGGLKAGFFYSWWDEGLNGETDSIGNNTEFNSIAYLYDGGSFQAGIAIDELEGLSTKPNGIGVQGIVSASLGGVSFDLLGGYDSEFEEGAIRALLSADLGPGVFQVAGIWASDPNAYWAASEWSVAASYRWNATDKLAITPGVQYWGSLQDSLTSFGNDDMWRAGLTVDYKITEGLATRVSVQYEDADNADDQVLGFVRLQRDF
ncbi:porin (plasmid) [Ensifer adhaerens]|uniref:porin n=1 Tax=Ensifer adhaerens TaxID=106592 RepID=UPI001CBFFF53|nr:porin [Ensifer adhaerens]UAY08407.1 porin [Ensifer adhaerens]UAY12889.1 porin [Ensifer adhaerens]